MAGFKGTRNEKGRPKGTPNKETAQVRESFKLLVENNIDTLQTDLDSLKPIERIKVIIDLAKFVMPTLKAIDHTEKNTDTENIARVQIVFTKPNDDDDDRN